MVAVLFYYVLFIFFMKKIILVAGIFATASASMSKNVFAYDFTDNIYGKTSIKLGYSVEETRGDVKGEADREGIMNGSSYYLTNLGLSAEYDVYYKATELLHPFVGIELTGRIPMMNRSRAHTKQFNYFSLDLKLGTKINNVLNDNISLQPYGKFGYVLLGRENYGSNPGLGGNGYNGYFKTKMEFVSAFNYGGGIDVIFDLNKKLAIIAGLELKAVQAFGKTKYSNVKLSTRQLEVKVGVQF